MESRQLLSLYERASQQDKARLLSLRLPQAARAFTMVPSTERQRLSDEQFSYAVQLRLGLPVLPHAPSVCPLCNTNIAGNACHAIGCAMMRRTALTKRHDGIAKCLHAFFERHDLPSQLEPRVDGERLKPDVEVVINGSTFFLDVSLVSPVEATYVQRASEDAFAPLRSREQHKITKYSEVAREAGGVVVPFVLSSFGGYGEKASGFISTLRSALLAAFDPFSDSTAGDPVAQLLRDIAAATQRGNAAAVMEARNRSGIRGRDAANLIWGRARLNPRHSA
jgi:hypothetical protein